MAMSASQSGPLTVASRSRQLAGTLARRLAHRVGFELTRPHDVATVPRGRTEPFIAGDYAIAPHTHFEFVRRWYYSPLPDLASLPADIFERRSRLGGVDLQVDRGIEFVERELAGPIAELDVPADDPGRPKRFYLHNGNLESVDAELLYAMVRSGRPSEVIELGSGYSTLLINLAARRNLAEGSPLRHEAFDPYRREHIVGDGILPDPTILSPVSATDVPLDRFAELQAGDILFVDTTHTVKLGSDVNHVILDVLPALAPGVIVHFHDIFLPWEYPRVWFEEMEYFWAEQYLLQAFLAYNTEWEVIVPAQAIAREYPERLRAVVPSFGERVSPGSFWIRRRG
jgi:hypothetical protein